MALAIQCQLFSAQFRAGIGEAGRRKLPNAEIAGVRRAARRDANHQSVGEYLRNLGWSVLDLADAGDGVPDYAVSKDKFAALVEVKDGSKPPSARKLTPKEQQVKDNWQGPYIVALSGEDAAVQLLCLMNGWAR